MLYFTGDTHADFSRFSMDNFPLQKLLTKDDYIIICGDFGGVWCRGREMDYWLKWLTDKSFTTLFIDGNHENFDLLNSYSVEDWCGGKIHKITDSIYHLMRGQIFTIDNKNIFTFGGARSHDISGGILNRSDHNFAEQRHRLIRENALFRIDHESWWQEEMPSEDEYDIGLSSLAHHDYIVDYVVTHSGPNEIIDVLSHSCYGHDDLTDYLDRISKMVTFSHWFFGHYHANMEIGREFTLLYETIVDCEGNIMN